MSILELCEQIQDAWLSRVISQSTWGYPIVGALHVLAIGIFGGGVIFTNLSALGFMFRGQAVGEIRLLKSAGLMVVVLTGALLFASGAVRYAGSTAFRVKMVLLALILLNAITASHGRRPKLHAGISLAIWTSVIFAARGIAFF